MTKGSALAPLLGTYDHHELPHGLIALHDLVGFADLVEGEVLVDVGAKSPGVDELEDVRHARIVAWSADQI